MTTPYAALDGLIRVYPAAVPAGAGLVWAHGGAFSRGDLDMPESHEVAQTLAAAGVTVASVDYRLVGEGCRYPAPSDDMLTAWRWLHEHRDELEVTHLAIGGTSAGGNLAAGATLRLLLGDGPGLPLPDLVVLAYPTLHAVQPPTPPELRALLDANPIHDRFGDAVQREIYEDFLGGPIEDAPVAAIPGTASREQLTGFPPTLMINDEIDELRASGEGFARQLAEAGTTVDVSTSPGTAHGHLNVAGSPQAAASLARIAARLTALTR